MIDTLELKLTSALDSSLELTLDSTEAFEFDIEGVSVSSVDYFNIEGRRCKITSDFTTELKTYLVNNWYDDVTLNSSLSDKSYYFGFYISLIINGELEFYGAIPKDSIDASKTNQTITFDLDDMISVFKKLAYKGIVYDYDEMKSAKYWINDLHSIINDYSLRVPINPADMTFINNWRQTTERYTEGNISADYYYSDVGVENTYETYDGEVYLTDKSDARLRLVENVNDVNSEYRRVRFGGSVSNTPSDGWQYWLAVSEWTKDEVFDGVIVQSVAETNNVSIAFFGSNGYAEGEDAWSTSEAYTHLEEKIAEEYASYLNDEMDWTSVTELTVEDVGSGTNYTYEFINRKIVYSGIIVIDNITLNEDLLYDGGEYIAVDIFNVIEQILFLTNHTMYQKGSDIYVEAKYPTSAEGYTPIAITNEELIDDLEYNRILYDEIDYASNVSYINIPEVSLDLIEWYYENILRLMLNKVSFKIDMIGKESVRPCQTITIPDEGDYIILSIEPDYINELLTMEAIKEIE